jgi:O-antigen/teichoic acid export membrane protein
VSGGALIGRARAHLRDPLYRNAYALMASTVITSGLGVAFWVTAARLYDAEDVGRDTALILAMQGLALVGQLNLGTAIVRFLPQIRRRARRAVLAVYAVSVTTVGALTTLFVLGAPKLAGDFAFLSGDARLGAGYVAAVVLWVIFVLQDSVLTALRRTGWVPIENAIYGALKLAALVALATAAATGHGILIAWSVPAVLIVPAISWLLFARLLPAHAESPRVGPSPLEAHGARKLVRFLGQDYLGSVLGQASLLCLPLLVVALLGSKENAYFAIPFALAMTVDLLFLNGATSLTVEGAHDERAARDLTRRLVRRVFGPLGLVALLAAVAAPALLWPFGPDYVAEGTGVLRLLLAAGVFRATIFVFIAVMRLRRQSGAIMALEGSLFALLLTLTLTLGPRLGREGVGLAWIVANGTVALVVGPWLLRFMRASDDEPEGAPLRLVTALPARMRRGREGTERVAGVAAPARSRPALGLVVAALALSVLAPAAVLAGAPGGVLFALVLGMFLLAPGTVLVGWLRPDEVGAGLGLVVGTSLAVTTVGAQLMLSAHAWSPKAGLCVLSVACTVPLALQLRTALAVRRANTAAERAQPLGVSVVVAGGVSGAALRATLRSILDAEEGDVQIIVVDRDPDLASTLEAVAGFADERLLYTCAPGATLGAARDAGMRVATGDVVVFAVPDSVVHEGWLDALLEPFSDPRTGCVVGRLPERGAIIDEDDLHECDALTITDLLWGGEETVAFATRRDLTPSPVVAYAPGALAWPQLRREQGAVGA